MKKSNKILIAACAVLSAGLLNAEPIYPGSILVTDINQKLMDGFDANDVVYELPDYINAQVDDELYAMATLVHVGYSAVEAHPRTSDFKYSTASGAGDIYKTGGAEQFTDTLLDLPDGAAFNFVRAWGYDSNATKDLRIIVFSSCLPGYSSGAVVTTTLGSFESSGTSGHWSAAKSTGGITIDNTNCNYFVRSRFNTTDSSLRMYKVRAELVKAS